MFEVAADAERHGEHGVRAGQCLDGGHVQVVVVVVGDDDHVDRAQGGQWQRDLMQALGAGEGEGEQRSPHTGSKSTRCPSISASTLEWPIQVSRSPVAGGRARSARVVACTGTGPCGDRRSRASLLK